MGDTLNRQSLSIGVPATGYAPNTTGSFQQPFVPTVAPPQSPAITVPPVGKIRPGMGAFGPGGLGGNRGRPYGSGIVRTI